MIKCLKAGMLYCLITIYAFTGCAPYMEASSTSNAYELKYTINNQTVAAGFDFHMFIDTDHTLWAWGRNQHGQLGNDRIEYSYEPIRVLDNVISVHASALSDTVFAILKDGSLWGWGCNRNGQLGNDIAQNQSIPIKILDDAIYVGSTTRNTFVIKSDNSLWAWGDNMFGQLGDGTTKSQSTPTKVKRDIVSIAISGDIVKAVDVNNNLWGWGVIDFSQYQPYYFGDTFSNENLVQMFGFVTFENTRELFSSLARIESTPRLIMEGIQKVNISRGVNAFVIKEDDSLWGWGISSEMDFISTENIFEPIPIPLMDNVHSVITSGAGGFAIRTDGSLWAWGDNFFYNLGDGTDIDRVYPVHIMDRIVSIHASASYTLALQENGHLYAWGFSDFLLGSPGDHTVETPTMIRSNILRPNHR